MGFACRGTAGLAFNRTAGWPEEAALMYCSNGAKAHDLGRSLHETVANPRIYPADSMKTNDSG